MKPEEYRAEIKAAIAHYEELGLCWLSVVTFIGIKALFGGWLELTKYQQSGMRLYKKKEKR